VLKGIDPLLTPDLLRLLAQAGHGDVIGVVDRNFPAHAQGAPVVDLPGADVTSALRAICGLLPIDVQFQDAPVAHMLAADGTLGPAVADVRGVLVAAQGCPVGMAGLAQSDFYDAAARAFAIVRTSDDRPDACFLVVKGVV